MDAVKAVSEIDGSESVAQKDTPDLEVDFSHPEVEAVNTAAYMDGALTEEVIESADIDEELAEKCYEALDDDVWEDLDVDAEDIDLERVMDAAEDRTFDEDEVQTLIELQDRMSGSLRESGIVEGELMKQGEGQMLNVYKQVQAVAYGVAVVIVVALAIDTTP